MHSIIRNKKNSIFNKNIPYISKLLARTSSVSLLCKLFTLYLTGPRNIYYIFLNDSILCIMIHTYRSKYIGFQIELYCMYRQRNCTPVTTIARTFN